MDIDIDQFGTPKTKYDAHINIPAAKFLTTGKICENQ